MGEAAAAGAAPHPEAATDPEAATNQRVPEAAREADPSAPGSAPGAPQGQRQFYRGQHSSISAQNSKAKHSMAQCRSIQNIIAQDKSREHRKIRNNSAQQGRTLSNTLQRSTSCFFRDEYKIVHHTTRNLHKFTQVSLVLKIHSSVCSLHADLRPACFSAPAGAPGHETAAGTCREGASSGAAAAEPAGEGAGEATERAACFQPEP